MGAASDGLSIYNYVRNPSNHDLKDELLYVQQQIEEIKQSVTALINQVKEESIRTQYVSAERVIVEANRCYINFLNMSEPLDVLYWKREFLKWGGLVRESTSFLLDGVLGYGMLGSDILQTFADNANINVRYYYPCVNSCLNKQCISKIANYYIKAIQYYY